MRGAEALGRQGHEHAPERRHADADYAHVGLEHRVDARVEVVVERVLRGGVLGEVLEPDAGYDDGSVRRE